MALLLKTNGRIDTITPPNGSSFRFEGPGELYELLSTDSLQVIPIPDSEGEGGRVLVVDEEGKLKEGKQLNRLATLLFHEIGGDPYDFIMGEAVVLEKGELD